jgi:hypothetical protein
MPKKTTVKKSIVTSCIAESRSMGRAGRAGTQIERGHDSRAYCTENKFARGTV